MSRVKQGTKILVHRKTTGCPIEEVFQRGGDRYPREAPFFGWIGRQYHSESRSSRYHSESRSSRDSDVYVITYSGATGSGGDYYKRSDFQIFNEEFIKDGDIMI